MAGIIEKWLRRQGNRKATPTTSKVQQHPPATLLLLGLLTQLGQYYMTMSYQSEEISKLANLNYIGIIYALLLGYFFFGELFNMWSYIGMALVLLGVVLNVRYKNRLAKREAVVQEGVAVKLFGEQCNQQEK